jgi:RNA polymerase sigma-70 factor, ECF subfamily
MTAHGSVVLRAPTVAPDRVDDARLTAAAQAGCRVAFAQLVRRHDARVLGIARSMGCDPALADDLRQEVFVRALRGVGGFAGRSRFGTWLHSITVNVVRNHRARTRVFAELPGGGDVDIAATEDRCGPRRAALRHDLGLAIARLPQAHRVVVELHYAHQLGYAEIAAELAMPLGTVKTVLHRAKHQLREMLPEWSPAADDPSTRAAA